MSETEISQSPEGRPPESPGGSGSASPPDGPRAAGPRKPKIGDTRPAPAVPPVPKAAAPVVALDRPETTAPKEGGTQMADRADPSGDGAGKRARSRRRSGRDRKSKQVGRYLVCVHLQQRA